MSEHELRGLPGDLRDVFNNISLQCFDVALGASVADEFWSDADEPRSSGNAFDQEIVWNEQSHGCA